MKKFNGKFNMIGEVIQIVQRKENIKTGDLCRELELIGIALNGNEINTIKRNEKSVKDFELVALCKVLGVDFEDLKKFFDQILLTDVGVYFIIKMYFSMEMKSEGVYFLIYFFTFL